MGVAYEDCQDMGHFNGGLVRVLSEAGQALDAPLLEEDPSGRPNAPPLSR